MKVKKEHYIKAISYLEDIASNTFFYRLNEETEKIYSKYMVIQNIKKKEKDRKEELDEKLLLLSKELKEIYEPYKKVYFDNNINIVVAYLKDLDIEEVFHINFIINSKDDENFFIIKKAIENINSISINATILSILWGCTRQSINYFLAQGKIQDTVIGHVTAFKLLDVI